MERGFDILFRSGSMEVSAVMFRHCKVNIIMKRHATQDKQAHIFDRACKGGIVGGMGKSRKEFAPFPHRTGLELLPFAYEEGEFHSQMQLIGYAICYACFYSRLL